MDQKSAKELLRKHRLGILTEEEKAILESWYIQQAQNKPSFVLTEDELKEDFSQLSNNVISKIGPQKKWYNQNYIKFFFAAASLGIMFFVASIYLKWGYDATLISDQEQSSNLVEGEILPGTKKAILTLGNNTQVVLDDDIEGNISNQNGIQIQRTKEGKVLYTLVEQDSPNSNEVQYNSISTPGGGEYEIQLTDGTKVWLNAMSSIRFPTKFRGDRRQVEIAGEVYFDVSHNPNMPFQVIAGRQIVEVLGTQFNINAYEKDIKTSLLEGSVKVSSKGSRNSRILKPGDQSVLSATSNSIRIQQIDVEQVLAWKNGYFIFDDDDFENVMKQIERWYDVKVDYSDNVQNIKIGGAIARKRNLQDVLDLLELSATVKFKMEGRKVIVSK